MNKAKTKPLGATSYTETIFGITSRSKLLKLEIEGTKRGLEYISKVSKDKTLIITPEFICKIHDISFGWIFPEWAGKYRKIQVTFSDKEAPPYFQLPELIINLCEDFAERVRHLPKRDTDEYISAVVELLAWFQHRFVFIHPFQDYNGRTARMLTLFILLKLNLPLIELKAQKGVDRKNYLNAMKKADKEDYSSLETLIGESLIESLRLFQKTE